jgi:hypothetical protein
MVGVRNYASNGRKYKCFISEGNIAVSSSLIVFNCPALPFEEVLGMKTRYSAMRVCKGGSSENCLVVITGDVLTITWSLQTFRHASH